MTIGTDKIFQTTTLSTGNLIDDFVADTRGTESPELFRKWSAIAAISGLAQRRIWCDIGKGKLFPNQYILLVSPPGVGKSVVLKLVDTLWTLNKKIHIGDETTTVAGLLDFLQDCASPVTIEGHPENTHPITVAPREYGTYMKAYDLGVLNVLNDFWDCPKSFSEMTRGGGKNTIEYPVLNIISGTQPSFLNNVLPEEAWQLGFCSRLILVYDWKAETLRTRDRLRLPAFPIDKYAPIVDALCSFEGELTFTDDALDLFDEWIIDQKMAPVPYHPRLLSYVARRPVHWLKVAMCVTLAAGDKVITHPHLEKAKAILLEMENMVPEIFRDMSKESDKDIIDEVKLALIRLTLKQAAFPERKLVQLLTTKVAAHRVSYFIETLISAGYITECEAPKGSGAITQWGNKGYRFFKAGIDLNQNQGLK